MLDTTNTSCSPSGEDDYIARLYEIHQVMDKLLNYYNPRVAYEFVESRVYGPGSISAYIQDIFSPSSILLQPLPSWAGLAS